MLNSSRISAGGSGVLTITGTGGVNTVIGLRGVVINSSSSVFTAGGAININGYHGTNGSDNSDGVTMDNATIGSNTSGPITITGTAGGGTGSEAISLSTANTIGGAIVFPSPERILCKRPGRWPLNPPALPSPLR
jgi:hypothetical protein